MNSAVSVVSCSNCLKVALYYGESTSREVDHGYLSILEGAAGGGEEPIASAGKDKMMVPSGLQKIPPGSQLNPTTGQALPSENPSMDRGRTQAAALEYEYLMIRVPEGNRQGPKIRETQLTLCLDDQVHTPLASPTKMN